MSGAATVGIVMGSKSDRDAMMEATKVLDGLEISWEMKIASAHRTPEIVHQWAASARNRGVRVLICGAGMAAHLAGVVAAISDLPVIGVPLGNSALGGVDALLATVQMPAGVPVATVAVGKAGARNAAHLAARILAVSDEDLAQRLSQQRAEMAHRVLAHDAELQADLTQKQ